MVMRALREHDPEHLRDPMSRGDFRKVLVKIVVSMIGFGIGVAVALLIALSAQSDVAAQTDRIADQTARIAALVAAIQQSRFQASRDNCDETNSRHDRTYLRLGSSPRPAYLTRKQFTRQLAFSRGLVDALAPRHADCAKFARRRVQTATPKPKP
jgi:hypothetical protein